MVPRAIAQKRSTASSGLLSKKAVRLAVLLGTLLLASSAINAFIIIVSSSPL